MANKLVTALKENTNNIRTKVAVTTGIVVTVVIVGAVLNKYNNQVTEDALDLAEDAIALAEEAVANSSN